MKTRLAIKVTRLAYLRPERYSDRQMDRAVAGLWLYTGRKLRHRRGK